VEIETERLRLRRATTDDLDELVAIHADPEIERFMDRFGPDEAASWLAGVDRNWSERGYGRVLITDRVTGRLLGRTGLAYFPDFSEIELGWTLRRNAWGNGYATEAARACADWAFRDFEIPHLISLIEPTNDRSVQVAHRLGMSALREVVAFGRPMIMHAVTRDIWLANSGATTGNAPSPGIGRVGDPGLDPGTSSLSENRRGRWAWVGCGDLQTGQAIARPADGR
jgi:RimJ/RimL family protein N-acetyltransferase